MIKQNICKKKGDYMKTLIEMIGIILGLFLYCSLKLASKVDKENKKNNK